MVYQCFKGHYQLNRWILVFIKCGKRLDKVLIYVYAEEYSCNIKTLPNKRDV